MKDKDLKEVFLEIVVILVGGGNDYGHPHKEILELLEKNNIKIFRTDLEGTIVLESDGGKYKSYRIKVRAIL